MREIKFRALYRGVFVYGNLIQGVFNGIPFYEIEYSDSQVFHKWQVDEETIGQFTGLKDKNGNDIYEGDICQVDNNENANHLQTVNCNYAERLKKGDLLIIKKLLSGYTGQILSNQGEQPNLIGNVCNYSLWNGSRQLIIVGNIHETPELLTL